MTGLHDLILGFAAVLSPYNLLVIFFGSMVGTVVGMLPGLGPSAGIALMIPLTLGMPKIAGLALLVGVYMGTMYGGRISSILINTPGDAPAIMTAMDGYPLMQQGRGGMALGISAIASFFGGCFGLVVLTFGAPVIAGYAIRFGSAEYFMLMVMGLSFISVLAGKSITKALLMTFLGFLVGMVGSDYVSGYSRMVFHQELIEGVDFVAVIIGLYGIGEVLFNVEKRVTVALEQPHFSLRQMFPGAQDIKKAIAPMLRGSLIGTLVGILPGAGGTTATFISYAVEKKVSKTPEKFGQGALEGLASVEGSNNASVPGALIPLLTLGIPGSGGTAIMLGALIMYGLKPGPLLMVESGDVVWATIAGLYAANFFLLISNILLIPLFISLMQIIQKRLTATVAALCLLGAVAINYTTFNVWVVVVFGVLGYLFKKLNYPTAPFILSLVLAPLTENYFRQALMLARGDFTVFFTRPISLSIFLVILGTFVFSFLKKFRHGKSSQAAA